MVEHHVRNVGVESSNLFFSTIHIVCKNKGFPRILVFAEVRPAKGQKGVLQHFTTLYRVGKPEERAESVHTE